MSEYGDRFLLGGSIPRPNYGSRQFYIGLLFGELYRKDIGDII